MKPNSLRLSFAVVLLCAACNARAQTYKEDADAAKKRAQESAATAGTGTKAAPQRVDQSKAALPTTNNDAQPVVPAPAAPTKVAQDTQPKDPAAEAEKARLESESALARGEGERYARRQKAYEAARAGGSRVAVEAPKRTSIAELQLADGHCVVLAGGNRTVFPNKAAADAFVAEIKRAEFDQPMVLGPAPVK